MRFAINNALPRKANISELMLARACGDVVRQNFTQPLEEKLVSPDMQCDVPVDMWNAQESAEWLREHDADLKDFLRAKKVQELTGCQDAAFMERFVNEMRRQFRCS